MQALRLQMTMMATGWCAPSLAKSSSMLLPPRCDTCLSRHWQSCVVLLHELTNASHTVCPQAILRKTKPRELGSGARVVSPHAHGVLAAGSFSTTVCSRTRSHMVIVRHAPRTSYRARRKCARVCKSTLSGPPTAHPPLQRERTQVLPLRMLAAAAAAVVEAAMRSRAAPMAEQARRAVIQ